MGPDRHSMTEMHRSTDDSTGADIPAGHVPVAQGDGTVVWEDAAAVAGHGLHAVPPTETIGTVTELLADGIWSWFTDPRAVYDSGLTFFGWVNTDGDVGITSYDHSDASIVSFTLHAALEVDDHVMVAILVREVDKRVMAFYTAHDDTTIRLRISTNPLDVSAFAAEVSLDSSLGGDDYDYPNPFQLLDEASDPIHLFYREVTSTTYALTLSTSTDDGSTWSAGTTIASGTRSYWKIVQNGQDRVDFAFTNAHPNFSDPSIYHFYYHGGAYYKTDGTAMGAPPFDTSDMTLVYDGTTDPGWIWDIAIDPATRRPVVAFATFPTTSDHRYRYGTWDGTEWRTVEVTDAGDNIYGTGDEPHYSAGVALDHQAPGIVYACREVDSQFELWRFVTRDGGATFSGEAVTSGSTVKNIRPVSVRGSGPLRVLWAQGTYTTYLDYDTAIMGAFLTSTGAIALDDLTDVIITSPVEGQRLRFDGTDWVNTDLIWKPVLALDPDLDIYLPVHDGSGDPVVAEG